VALDSLEAAVAAMRDRPGCAQNVDESRLIAYRERPPRPTTATGHARRRADASYAACGAYPRIGRTRPHCAMYPPMAPIASGTLRLAYDGPMRTRVIVSARRGARHFGDIAAAS